MPLTATTITGFLNWWKKGLAEPFETFVSKASPIVLKRVGNSFLDLKGQPFSINNSLASNRSIELYLLAPHDKLMSKRITESQKGVPLGELAEEVLPFKQHELVLARDSGETTLLAVLKSDMSADVELAQEQGARALSVAFDLDGQLIFTGGVLLDELLESAPRNGQTIMHLKTKMITAFVILGIFGLGFAINKALSVETERQIKLRQELRQLQSHIDATQLVSEKAISERIKIRSATDLSETLSSLTSSLTDTTVLSQVILSGDELIIDARSDSATQVQAQLDASGAFAMTEFVSSISRNVADGSERFRLKATVKDEVSK